MYLHHLSQLLILSVIVLGVSSWLRKRPPRGFRKVPGPRGLPFVGNLLQLSSQPQREINVWARQYGELFRLNLGWDTWVFISSPEAHKEILESQSGITSGRPPRPVSSDVVSGGLRLVLMSYTLRWRKLRATVHKLLTPKASGVFKPSQEFEAKQLLYDLLVNNKNLEEFYMHVRRYTTSVVMTSTYGKRVPTWDREDYIEVYAEMDDFSRSLVPGEFIADLFPPLARLPTWLQWWRERALEYHRRQAHIWLKHWRNLRQQIAEKRAPECFVKQYIESEQKKEDFSEMQGAFVAGTMIEAGSDTTSATLNSCIKYLAMSPAVQQRANEELSAVIGDHRFPTFNDEAQLPYVRAIVKEIPRMRPITRFGTPHYTTADVKYKDFFIPKNTVLSVATYALHFDPDRYDEPFVFKPERYLGHPLKAGVYAAMADPYARDHFNFGSGRRICPGMHLAENSLFITIAKILWAFQIAPPLDADGKEEAMDLSPESDEPGMITSFKKYKVRFLPRNEQRKQTLLKEWETAVSDGFYLGKVKVDINGMVVA
ncbi:uncharacterized protein A1O5_13377 [Cladophialophora psammophila CBS 110553]|uniref:O-methylsterigmatocystin oxidoreductase n=1 Tax=Cladophialophora psammophila CBS 110553 TaxID=1182543 RepID=W9VD63_9EURO|nr:uncharacterized protein A1O5_13377 [Cladophialophora psammophila CBS 110553]EXJ53388.1 hypothetical protein A1O5_13377 [Cladophialophora psammophila CBS 110553]